MDIIPGSMVISSPNSDEIGDGNLSTNSISPHENSLENIKLLRKGSNGSNYSSHGYLFLSIVFCMMCCSSIVMTPLK